MSTNGRWVATYHILGHRLNMRIYSIHQWRRAAPPMGRLVLVIAAGNYYYYGANTTLSSVLNVDGVIAVGARNLTSSSHTSYATIGTSILVAGISGYDYRNDETGWNDLHGIVTTGPYPYQPVNLRFDGTSAACPMIAGLCALILSYTTKHSAWLLSCENLKHSKQRLLGARLLRGLGQCTPGTIKLTRQCQ